MNKFLKATAVLTAAISLIFVSCKGDASSKDVTYEPTQQLTNSIVSTPAKAEYSQGTTKNYFYFGDYPQKKVAASDLPAMSTKPSDNGWYVGSDGKYYGKIGDDFYEVTPILWCEITSDYDYDGHSEDADNSSCSNKASLLVAESILAGGVPYYNTCTAYYAANNVDEAKANDSNIRVIGGKEIFTNNYEYSQLRAFLLGTDYIDLAGKSVSSYKGKGFLQGAFSAEAQSRLITVDVMNDGKSGTEPCENGYGTTCDSKLPISCDTTKDKVFVLSMFEYGNPAYGFGHGNEAGAEIMNRRKRSSTEYAAAAGATTDYWERTPYYKNTCSLRYVNDEGRTYLNTLANDSTVGVVPAIVVKIAE
ncbi:MAG: DUF6273 domain-containing protein [Treponema sp.]|nr:DUF6273 domain-containing protein [Treponema sp.]